MIRRAWFELQNWWHWRVRLPVAYWRERARYALFADVRVGRDIVASRGPWWAVRHEPTPAPVEDLEGCVGPGWRPIVRALAADLFRVGWSGGVSDVKEKYAGLRFHCVGDGEPALWHAIMRAERESLRTCDRCGASGRVRGGGWLVTRCDACEGKR